MSEQSLVPPGHDLATLAPPPERGIFCNRTLNLNAIRAIGYDMDYTLIHYRVQQWEQRAYQHLKSKLADRGWPVDALEFDASSVARGLVLDLELGNIVKPNRFGYVKQARHGLQVIDHVKQREIYGRVIVHLAQDRFVFVNTAFSLSEVCMYAQLVDLLDQGKLPRMIGYRELYHHVRRSLDEAHMEGELKADVVARPEVYIDRDPELPLTLLDQRDAGKKLLLITNSGWPYTQAMMGYAFDGLLPGSMTWQELFEVVIVGARKPQFFTSDGALFEIINQQGHLRPAPDGIRDGRAYMGGTAEMVSRLTWGRRETKFYMSATICFQTCMCPRAFNAGERR